MSADTIDITVTDVTGQREFRGGFPSAATVDEVVQSLLSDMEQPRTDPAGRPLVYGVRSDNLGRFLGGNERVGDALESNDILRLMPSVDAG